MDQIPVYDAETVASRTNRVSGDEKPLIPLPMFEPEDDVCCGPPVKGPCSPLERPGYKLMNFVERFLDTPAGQVPIVKTDLDKLDFWGTFLARSSGARDSYKIAPGLYGLGRPGPQSPVLATANYKLTFDDLRSHMKGTDGWILVLDTRGINVWCAAGKKLFGAEEVARRVKLSGLERVVDHRRLILPQLSAAGVSARAVKKMCGFEVVWGPIRAGDIKSFLNNGLEADPGMRRVTFDFKERLVLTPVELSHLGKPVILILSILFFISGFGPDVFSWSAAWTRGLTAASGLAAGILAGAILGPALLPWLPGTAFAVKGAVAGVLCGSGLAALWRPGLGWLGGLALVLWSAALGSYLTMNFTGSTPYTSPSGVEKEMRRAIPLQAGTLVITAAMWIASAFAA